MLMRTRIVEWLLSVIGWKRLTALRVTDTEPHEIGFVRLPQRTSKWEAIASVVGGGATGRCITERASATIEFDRTGHMVCQPPQYDGHPVRVWFEARLGRLHVMAENQTMLPWIVRLHALSEIGGCHAETS